MNFTKRLLDLRKENNMKQKDIEVKLNLGPNAISKYENGRSKPNIQTLIKMSEIFKCSVDYLLGLSSIRNPYTSDNFSPKEAEIIVRYRKLTRENQIRIDERIRAMIDGQR